MSDSSQPPHNHPRHSLLFEPRATRYPGSLLQPVTPWRTPRYSSIGVNTTVSMVSDDEDSDDDGHPVTRTRRRRASSIAESLEIQWRNRTVRPANITSRGLALHPAHPLPAPGPRYSMASPFREYLRPITPLYEGNPEAPWVPQVWSGWPDREPPKQPAQPFPDSPEPVSNDLPDYDSIDFQVSSDAAEIAEVLDTYAPVSSDEVSTRPSGFGGLQSGANNAPTSVAAVESGGEVSSERVISGGGGPYTISAYPSTTSRWAVPDRGPYRLRGYSSDEAARTLSVGDRAPGGMMPQARRPLPPDFAPPPLRNPPAPVAPPPAPIPIQPSLIMAPSLAGSVDVGYDADYSASPDLSSLGRRSQNPSVLTREVSAGGGSLPDRLTELSPRRLNYSDDAIQTDPETWRSSRRSMGGLSVNTLRRSISSELLTIHPIRRSFTAELGDSTATNVPEAAHSADNSDVVATDAKLKKKHPFRRIGASFVDRFKPQPKDRKPDDDSGASAGFGISRRFTLLGMRRRGTVL